MNRSQLKEALRREHIRDDAYDLAGGHLPETYTVGERNGCWVVYYSERGLETAKTEFATEPEAYQHLLNILREDPTIRSAND